MNKKVCMPLCSFVRHFWPIYTAFSSTTNVDKKLERTRQKVGKKCTEEHTKKPCRGTAF